MITSIRKSNKTLNILLWVSQILLALFYAFVGATKLSLSMPELTDMMKWPAISPEWFVRLVGLMELLGAIGLILPALTRIQIKLLPAAAAGLFVLQICAIIFHVARSEFFMLPVNTGLLLIAAFILWGRLKGRPLVAV